MRTLQECQKWISKSASTIQEARFCTGGVERNLELINEADYHLEAAINSLIEASKVIREQIEFDEAQFQHENRFL